MDSLRSEFSLFDRVDVTYLDSAATTQRPDVVLEAMDDFYRGMNANVHRGVHRLSQEATDAFDEAREVVRSFVGARESAEILWTKGCTESLNLVAQGWGSANLKPGDEVLLSTGEHHANIVPWQMVAARTGAIVRPIPVSDGVQIDLDALRGMVHARTRVIGVKHVCNASGVINPVKEIGEVARSVGAILVVDGAQALAHVPVNVVDLGADFYAMSSHKVYGPMGMGALYGCRELLEAMPPFLGGGDMIKRVSFEGTTYNDLPNKFEPGTPNVAGAIGFAAALKWVESKGVAHLAEYENGLAAEARLMLGDIDGVRLVGSGDQASVVSFTADFAHPHDLGTILDQHGVAVRTGHHCCMPLMDRLGVAGTTRASFAAYNMKQDIKVLIEGVMAARAIFA